MSSNEFHTQKEAPFLKFFNDMSEKLKQDKKLTIVYNLFYYRPNGYFLCMFYV